MVLQGDTMLQKDESKPVEGFTVTEMSADLTPWRHDTQSRIEQVRDAVANGRVFRDDASLLNFIPVEFR